MFVDHNRQITISLLPIAINIFMLYARINTTIICIYIRCICNCVCICNKHTVYIYTRLQMVIFSSMSVTVESTLNCRRFISFIIFTFFLLLRIRGIYLLSALIHDYTSLNYIQSLQIISSSLNRIKKYYGLFGVIHHL